LKSSARARVVLAAAGVLLVSVALGVAPSLTAQQPPAGSRGWWSPGDGRVLPATAEYDDPFGKVGILNTDGPVATKGHPFFEAIGRNGRACVTCHQPANAMSISVDAIQARWRDTKGTDPLFAAIDGSNCPSLPQDDPASHSLLLKRGLFRVSLPWPPQSTSGAPIEPEFTIEVVRDPSGCNASPVYGLKSPSPRVSVYRRPRLAANLKYVIADGFGISTFIIKNGQPAARDPETGRPLQMNMMSDAREVTLTGQAISAAITHLETAGPPSAGQLERIVAFERQIYTAQRHHLDAGDLVEPGGPPALGPAAMAQGRTAVLGNNTTNFIFPMGEVWRTLPRTGDRERDARNAFRESVARGHDVFFFRTFWIRDAMHINTVGLGNPVKRTCSTCHGMHMTGMDTVNGWMDVGTTNLPWATEPPQSPWSTEKAELPLFKLACTRAVAPHPFLGRVIYTQDPGRALISGKCNDIGTIVMQQFRGLAARAPYFSNGSARSLPELVDFYDRRFNIQLSERERQDLVNFLSVL
jgi:hypothetical protein